MTNKSIKDAFRLMWEYVLAKVPTSPSDIGAAAASHNQSASTITAGTFSGQVVANASGQSSESYVVRNSKTSASAESPTVAGQICWKRA